MVPSDPCEQVGGQAVLGRQNILPTPWLTERHGYDPTCRLQGIRLFQAVAEIAMRGRVDQTVIDPADR